MLRFKKAKWAFLDRVFRLIVEEIKFADPDWSQRIALESLNVDSFAQAWFAERKQRDPFDWAEENLREVERNKREKHTVPRRYVILRLHEAVQEIVPHLNEHDHKRFSKGLAGFSSIIMRQSLQSLFVDYWPYVKRESFIFSPSVKTTKWKLMSRAPS